MQNQLETAIVIQPKSNAISAIISSQCTASKDSLVFSRNTSSMVAVPQNKILNIELGVLTMETKQEQRESCFLFFTELLVHWSFCSLHEHAHN